MKNHSSGLRNIPLSYVVMKVWCFKVLETSPKLAIIQDAAIKQEIMVVFEIFNVEDHLPLKKVLRHLLDGHLRRLIERMLSWPITSN